jgi:hypothetical protein
MLDTSNEFEFEFGKVICIDHENSSTVREIMVYFTRN